CVIHPSLRPRNSEHLPVFPILCWNSEKVEVHCYDVSLVTSELPVSHCTHSSVTAFASCDRSSTACGADMSRQRFTDDPSMGRRAPPSSSAAALDTTQLLERLARSIISERCGRRESDAAAAPSEAQIH
ncbi:unnamed protein product, partial [Ectocarpus sp. 4 AP-2014]